MCAKDCGVGLGERETSVRSMNIARDVNVLLNTARDVHVITARDVHVITVRDVHVNTASDHCNVIGKDY